MFRCSRALRISVRMIQTHSGSDPLLEKLKNCRNEHQLFQLVGINKSLLEVNHVSWAMKMLHQIQKEQTSVYSNVQGVLYHPEFIALRNLAENNVSCMEDSDLVDTLYILLSFKVEPHHPLLQQLVIEGWKRLERFNFSSLSKFCVCLVKQDLPHSVLHGQIANIVDKNLDNLKDLRFLSILMIHLQFVCSPSLQHRLITKMESLIEDEDAYNSHTLRRVLQFLENMGSIKPSLWEKITPVVIRKIKEMDLITLRIIFEVYMSQAFNHSEVQVKIKSRLLELLETCESISDFMFIVAILLPIVPQETRERLENDLSVFADKMSYTQLLTAVKAMSTSHCRNRILIHTIGTMIHKNLDRYMPSQLCSIAFALPYLPYQNGELLEDLQQRLIRKLKMSVITSQIIMMTSALSAIRSGSVEEAIVSKLDAIVPQCDLSQTNEIGIRFMKWLKTNPEKSSYSNLNQKLHEHILAKIRNIENIDDFLEELKNLLKREWFDNAFVEATLDSCQLLLHQVTWRHVVSLSRLITQHRTRCIPILDKIATVTIENIAKVPPSELYVILKSFSYLNYEPPNGEEFYNACLQQYRTNLDSFKPDILVQLGYMFAYKERFPEELVKAIFNIDFLSRLDLELEVMKPFERKKIRRYLMELNRAVCLECPEYQIPWFHDQYNQQLRQTERDHENYKNRQIRQLLGKTLGGIQYTRVSVVTPYHYHIDFECILDKNRNPISYMDLNLLSTDVDTVPSGIVRKMQEYEALPPGAERVAVEFLEPSDYCQDQSDVLGVIDMKRRHLEILGYYVIQIPFFEWNSVELRTTEAWINYLRRKIFLDKC